MVNVVSPSFEILGCKGGMEILKSIERAGRTCYKSEDKITDDSCVTFAKAIVKRGHFSVIEHESIAVRIICDRGCCYSDDTQVFTKNGWKLFKDVNEEDLIACLDDNGYIEFNRYVKKYEYFNNEDMMHFSNNYVDFLVTKNHKMWVEDFDRRVNTGWKFIEAEKMVKKGRYSIETGYKWVGNDVAFNIPSHPTLFNKFPEIKLDIEQTDNLMELLGIGVADGCYRNGYKYGGGSCIQIIQKKKNVISRIKHLCDLLGFRCYYKENAYTFMIGDMRHLLFVKSVFGSFDDVKKSYSSFIPDVIKSSSSRQIKRFFDGLVLGDGTVRKEGSIAVYTASKKMADDIHEVVCKIGGSANIRVVKPSVRVWKVKNKVYSSNCVESYVVGCHTLKTSKTTIDKRENSHKNYGTLVNYNGMVYCLEVPYHRLFVRRNGRSGWSGNSHEIVRHRLASYSQESTRYCNYGNKGITVIKPCFWKEDSTQYKVWLKMMNDLATLYTDLVGTGSTPQEARCVLPNSLKTEIVMTANLREWRHFFIKRTDVAAHPQMREIAIPLLEEMRKLVPVIFDDLVEEV